MGVVREGEEEEAYGYITNKTAKEPRALLKDKKL
jgi:hypothetical protein